MPGTEGRSQGKTKYPVYIQQGLSLTPLLKGEDPEEWELFDLKQDPDEMHSVYSHPDYQDQVSFMKKELEKAWFAEVDTVEMSAPSGHFR